MLHVRPHTTETVTQKKNISKDRKISKEGGEGEKGVGKGWLPVVGLE